MCAEMCGGMWYNMVCIHSPWMALFGCLMIPNSVSIWDPEKCTNLQRALQGWEGGGVKKCIGEGVSARQNSCFNEAAFSPLRAGMRRATRMAYVAQLQPRGP